MLAVGGVGGVAVGAAATGFASIKNCAATQPAWPSVVCTFCHATPFASGGLAVPMAVSCVPVARVRNNVAVELGSDRRFRPFSAFTYRVRVASVAVGAMTVGVAVGAGVEVSALVEVTVGSGVAVDEVGVAADRVVAVAAGRAVLVATAAMTSGTLVDTMGGGGV